MVLEKVVMPFLEHREGRQVRSIKNSTKVKVNRINNIMIKKINDNSVRVCCGGKGCPVVEKQPDGRYKVTDDDGNVIIIKAEELELMGDAVKTIGGSDDTLICG